MKQTATGTPVRLPDTTQIQAVFQFLEDDWDASLPLKKAGMDAAAGFALTNRQARVFGKIWLNAKAELGNV